MQEFKIKAYGKSELALQYFPEAASAHTAVNHLMSWIRRNPVLTEELTRLAIANRPSISPQRKWGRSWNTSVNHNTKGGISCL